MNHARRMTKAELKTHDMTRRDARGNLQHFAVEHESGAKVTGLSWEQACDLAEERNECVVA